MSYGSNRSISVTSHKAFGASGISQALISLLYTFILKSLQNMRYTELCSLLIKIFSFYFLPHFEKVNYKISSCLGSTLKQFCIDRRTFAESEVIPAG